MLLLRAPAERLYRADGTFRRPKQSRASFSSEVSKPTLRDWRGSDSRSESRLLAALRHPALQNSGEKASFTEQD